MAAACVCGQAIMAAVDTRDGPGDDRRPRRVPADDDGAAADQLPAPDSGATTGEVLLTARILRRGKSLAFGEISVRTPDGKLAAQATTTYALL